MSLTDYQMQRLTEARLACDEKRFRELCAEYGITNTDSLVESMYEMHRAFHLEKLAQEIEQLQLARRRNARWN